MFGTDVSKARTATEAIEMSELDWEVAMAPLYVRAPATIVGPSGMLRTPLVATQRQDTGFIMGAHSKRFTPLQNHEVFSFFDSVVKDKGAEYRTAGALKDGGVVFLTAQLPTSLNLNGDIVDKYIVMLNGHDGSTGFRVVTSPIRPVCENTLYAAAFGGAPIIRGRHTPSIKDRVKKAQQTIRNADSYFTEFEAQATKLLETPMGSHSFTLFTRDLFSTGMGDYTEISSRAQVPLDETFKLFYQGKGNKGETAWDAYNAVTEYIDHVRPPKGKLDNVGLETPDLMLARTTDSMLGNGARVRQKAFQTLENWDEELPRLEAAWEAANATS